MEYRQAASQVQKTNKLLQDKTHDYKEMALRLSTDNYNNIHSKLGVNWNKKETTAAMKSLLSSRRPA